MGQGLGLHRRARAAELGIAAALGSKEPRSVRRHCWRNCGWVWVWVGMGGAVGFARSPALPSALPCKQQLGA